MRGDGARCMGKIIGRKPILTGNGYYFRYKCDKCGKKWTIIEKTVPMYRENMSL